MQNLRRPAGAQKGQQLALRNGSRAKLPVGNIKRARLEIQEALAAAAPLRDKDGGLPIADRAAVEIVAAGLARQRYMEEYLERVTPFTNGFHLRYTLVRELRRTEKQLLAALHELGMTPRGRAALGLDVARTGAALQTIKPVSTAERSRAVAVLIARAGGVVKLAQQAEPEDAEVVEVEPSNQIKRSKT
jgi:hypothetical protein